ncbi:unnamed protein product [Caenorhabditis angaria]|uniref:BTB domain-containing protein n=1 Tax=Caenorhabditis angaria TaxID=860376 RepID=A0A9P1N337_9PELO|nr:unnamed protein product [Caenorhabditis angaria]
MTRHLIKSSNATIQTTVEEIDFCDKNSTFNDIVFKFQDSTDKVLYSSKAMLSIHSKVFKVMFNSDFDEKNKDTIELDETFDEFEMLLKIIYPTKHAIDSENIETLMKLADKYDMPHLTYRCVEFLDNDKSISTDFKMLLADKFSIPRIHNECIRNFNGESLEKFEKSEVFEKLSDPTKILVLKRRIEVLSEEKAKGPKVKIRRY